LSKSTYDHNTIKVMEEIEHIQHNAGMYIGDTALATHLITEAYDNAVDEANAGYATVLAVVIDTKNNVYSVADNGRGIPIENDTIKTVASKLFSGGKFNKGEGKAYGIACLRGDTKIMLLDGRYVTIQYMAEHPNEEFWVLSSTTDGKWVPEKVECPSITGYTDELYRIHIDNNTFVDCTKEHKFLMRDGVYKEAKDLKSSDSLMPCYIKEIDGYTCIRPNNTYEYLRNIKFHRRGYKRLCKYVYEYLNDSVPFNYAIHHKDLNKKNDLPENLMTLDNKSEHLKIHVPELRRRGVINCDGLVKYNKSSRGRMKSSECGKKTIHKLIEYTRTFEHRQQKSRFMKKYLLQENIQFKLQYKKIKKYLKTLIVNNIKVCQMNWDKYRPYGVASFNKVIQKYDSIEIIKKQINKNTPIYDKLIITNGSAMIIKRILSTLDKIVKDGYDITLTTYEKYRSKYCPTIVAIDKYFGCFDDLLVYYKENNHKVIKIEKIKLNEKIPVYDIHTPINHNFVLSNGVVVHNSGRHGVGIVAITALSESNKIEVFRDKKKATYEWKYSKLINDEHIDHIDDIPFSTRITFKPNKKYFESTGVDINYIRKRMKIASIHIPKLKLVLRIDGNNEIINCDLDQYFKDDIVAKDKKGLTKPVNIHVQEKDEELSIRWAYSLEGSPASRQHGCVNLLSVDQGTHINRTFDMFRDIFMEFGKKDKLTFNKQDTTVGFRAYTSVMLYEPEYSSQNKERLSIAKNKVDHLYKTAADQLRQYLNDNIDLKNQLLSFFQTYRKKLDSSKAIIKSSGSVTRINSVIGSKLKDCTTHTVSDSELFITEGTSAEGSLLDCRNPAIHAVLPLKGKIPNTAAGGKDFLKNEEIKEIVNACGTGIEPDFSIKGLRYGKIIFACDADSDGAHISTLLMVLFLKMMPELIKNGHIYVAKMPLYGTQHNKKFYPFYSEDELNKFVEKYPKSQITRFKGLGEMNSSDIEVCLLEEKRRQLMPVTYPDDVASIFKLMIDSTLKRKLV